jgi:hypothetical protein
MTPTPSQEPLPTQFPNLRPTGTPEWSQLGRDLNENYRAGIGVSLSGDGSFVAVGGGSDSNSYGDVRVYEFYQSVLAQIQGVIYTARKSIMDVGMQYPFLKMEPH